MTINNRPRPVRAGMMLFYAALGLAGLRSIMEAATNAGLLGAAFLILMLAVILVVFGMMALLIATMGRGRNWARLTLLVLFLLSLIISLGPLLHSFALRPIPGGLGLAQYILQFVALHCLFQKEASLWFRAQAKRSAGEAHDWA
jgi:hypothetical protein